MPISSPEKTWGSVLSPHTLAAPETRVAPAYKLDDLKFKVGPDITTKVESSGGSWGNTAQALQKNKSKVTAESETLGYNALLVLLHAILITNNAPANPANNLVGVTDSHATVPSYLHSFVMQPFAPNTTRTFTVANGYLDTATPQFGVETAGVRFNKLSMNWSRQSVKWSADGTGGVYRFPNDQYQSIYAFTGMPLTGSLTTVPTLAIPPDQFCFFLSTTSYAHLIANGYSDATYNTAFGRTGTGSAQLNMLTDFSLSIGERQTPLEVARCNPSQDEYAEDLVVDVSFTHEYRQGTAAWMDRIRNGQRFWLQVASAGPQINNTPSNAGFLIEMCLYLENHDTPTGNKKMIATKFGSFRLAHDETFAGGNPGMFQWLVRNSVATMLGQA